MVRPDRKPPLGKFSLQRASDTSHLRKMNNRPDVCDGSTDVVYSCNASTMGSCDVADIVPYSRGYRGLQSSVNSEL